MVHFKWNVKARVYWLAVAVFLAAALGMMLGSTVRPVVPPAPARGVPGKAPAQFSRSGDRINSQYILEEWSSRDGLPQNTINEMVQTPDGYIWFATQEGLARFDGVRFVVYDQDRNPDLRISYMQSVAVGRDGSILLGTWKEGLYRLSDGVFRRLDTKKEFFQVIVYSILERPDGSVWVGTDRGLYVLAGGTCRCLSESLSLPEDEFHALVETADGTLWAGSAENGLMAIKGNTVRRYTTRNGLPDDRVFALAADPAGGILAGTGPRLSHIGPDGIRTWDVGVSSSESVIRDILPEGNGSVWICTQNSGVRRLSPAGVTSFTTADGLPNDNVLSILKDREGSVWVGTSGNGICRLRPRKVFSLSQEDGLSHRPVWSILESRDGSLWIGTDGGGLDRLRGTESEVFTSQDGLRSMSVTSLCEDRDGTLWIGTQGGGGLHRLEKGRVVSFPLGANQLERTVYAVFQDRSGSLWVGTARGLFRIRGGEVRKFSKSDGLVGETVRYFAEDSAGALWIASDGGLLRYRDGKFHAWTSRDGLPADFVRCIHIDRDGGMWLGTQNAGLCYFKDGVFRTVTVKDGLYNNVAYQILEDDAGLLWMSCNRGIYAVARADLLNFFAGRTPQVRCKAFGIKDGMKNNECNGGRFPAGVRLRNGSLCFPTMDGIAIVDPRRLPQNTLPPPVTIEAFRADKKDQAAAKEYDLAPGRGDVEIEYTALSFVSPEKVLFQYRLDPFDKEWVDAGKRRTAFYTNLPPGSYTFTVRACNDDGVWNERGASLRFRLAPHFHQTWWFTALCVLAGMIVVALFIRFRLRQLKAQRNRLEALVLERTSQLQNALQKVEEMANTDGLTGVANRRCLEDWIDREWKRSQRNVDELAVIMMDVDYFKKYNDTYGHLAGDDCLKKVASVMSAAGKRATDLAGRYGGEEFILILPATKEEGALLVAERIRAGVEALHIPHEKSSIAGHVTVSLGVAGTVPVHGLSWTEIVQNADEALYCAKNNGRNRVCGHTETKESGGTAGEAGVRE